MKLFEQIAKKFNIKQGKNCSNAATAADKQTFDRSGYEFLNSLSKHALKLYEKQIDIKNFTKLVLSDPENTSHNEIVSELFKKGVKDPLENEKLAELADNSKLLEDLGLND